MGYTCSPAAAELFGWYFEQIRSTETVQINVLNDILDGARLSRWLEDFQKQFLYHDLVQSAATHELAEKLLDAERLSWTCDS